MRYIICSVRKHVIRCCNVCQKRCNQYCGRKNEASFQRIDFICVFLKKLRKKLVSFKTNKKLLDWFPKPELNGKKISEENAYEFFAKFWSRKYFFKTSSWSTNTTGKFFQLVTFSTLNNSHEIHIHLRWKKFARVLASTVVYSLSSDLLQFTVDSRVTKIFNNFSTASNKWRQSRK